VQRLKKLGTGGRVLLAVAATAAIFGVVSVVQAATPPVGQSWYASGSAFSTGFTPTTVATVGLPGPGKYVVTATGWAAGLTVGKKDIRCGINGFQSNQDDTFLAVGLDTVSESGQQSWAISRNITTSSGHGVHVSVNCITDGDVNVLYGARLTAVSVSTLHGPSFTGISGSSTASVTPTS
jgi:hypothetical protein